MLEVYDYGFQLGLEVRDTKMYEGLEERGLGTEELRGRVTDSGRIKVVG